MNILFDLSAEQAVIGSIMIDSRSDRSQLALREVSADMFYNKQHQVIFEQIKLLTNQQKPVDIITVSEQLESKGFIDNVGGLAYLAECCKVPSTLNVKAYCSIIKNKAIERSILNTLTNCQEVLTAKSFMTTQDKLSEVQRIFTSMDQQIKNKSDGGLLDVNKIYIKWLTEVEARYEDPENARGLSTGIKALDAIVYPKGIVKGSLVVIGARPKMGKTSLLIKSALHCAIDQKKTTAIFSLEMPADQLFERMITQVSGVSGDVFYNSEKDESGFNKAMANIQPIIDSENIFVDDSPAINLHHIRSECRRLQREKGELGMIFVDYLTLMSAEKAERNDLAYGNITKGLKSLAKELGCVVVLITQLNRQVENRTEKRPYPSDSRDTGQIEQDCDYWIGLYKDSVYNESADPFLTEVILRLNRHGKTGTAYVNMKYGQMFDVDQKEARTSIERLKGNKNKNGNKVDF